jgi:hypothetical protein
MQPPCPKENFIKSETCYPDLWVVRAEDVRLEAGNSREQKMENRKSIIYLAAQLAACVGAPGKLPKQSVWTRHSVPAILLPKYGEADSAETSGFRATGSISLPRTILCKIGTEIICIFKPERAGFFLAAQNVIW